MADEAPDSFHTAPGWRVLGEKPHFSCVYPPGREPAPEVVAAVKEICPDIIPVWMSERYLPPDSNTPVTLGWHVLARHAWNPRGPHVQFGIHLPAGWVGPPPNIFEIPIQGEPVDGQPPPYEPFNWRTVAMLRRRYAAKNSTEMILRVQADNRRRRALAKRRFMQEEAYKRRDMNRWIARRIEQWDVDDWKQLRAQGAKRPDGNH